MRRFILGICLLAAIANIDAAAQKRLTILHVNDTHSHLEPERSGEHEGMGGVIERAAYRDSVVKLSLIHISEPTRQPSSSRMPSSA